MRCFVRDCVVSRAHGGPDGNLTLFSDEGRRPNCA